MNPAAVQAAIWFASELVKLGMNRLAQKGKFNNLTQAEAEAEFANISAALPVILPTPEELESGGA